MNKIPTISEDKIKTIINKRSDDLTKSDLELAASKGCYLYDRHYSDNAGYNDLDGTEARRFLESKGFDVLINYNNVRYGLAIIKCGIKLTSRGVICRHD